MSAPATAAEDDVLAYRAHIRVVELVPAPLQAQERVVVPERGPALVHEDAEERVLGRPAVPARALRQVPRDIECLRERELAVHLHHSVRGNVVLEAAEVNVENRRKLDKLNAHDSVLRTEVAGAVLVRAGEKLGLEVLGEGVLEAAAAFDEDREVVEVLLAGGLEVDVGAADKGEGLAAEELDNGVAARLELVLEIVKKNAAELLDIVLCHDLVIVPPKGLGEIVRRN